MRHPYMPGLWCLVLSGARRLSIPLRTARRDCCRSSLLLRDSSSRARSGLAHACLSVCAQLREGFLRQLDQNEAKKRTLQEALLRLKSGFAHTRHGSHPRGAFARPRDTSDPLPFASC